MDKGAHFYKSDFQVHTPRDHNWTGCEPVSHEDRLAFARQFVQHCRAKGIRAVGITDHHDVCFAKYIQLAAQESDHERPTYSFSEWSMEPSRQNPIVFPGIEVTLSLPCQAIILLDADTDPETQIALLHAIGVGNTHPDTDPKGPEVVSVPRSFQELNDALNNYAQGKLRGRYIILPNVSDNGYRTLLRSGFHNHFAQMPCVGGYIEGDWSDHRSKHKLDGSLRDYGYKALGVFQTSDSRRQDCHDLGCRTTWVKMASPTAEALRQACLARQSRINQSEPLLPTVYINRLDVSDSSFLGRVDIQFNQQFNALIGGRGTGKTTILEYLRYGMQDQPPETNFDDAAHDEISDKRSRIIETLHECAGSVIVEWMSNGVPHTVAIAHKGAKATIQVGNDDPKETTSEELKSILPIQAYSQKQLSTVGTREKELRRFIEQPVRASLAELKSKIADKRHELEQLYDRLIETEQKARLAESLRTQLRSIQEQARAAEESLPQLPENLQTALKQNPLRLRESQAVSELKADIGTAKAAIGDATRALAGLPRPLSLDDSSPHGSLLHSVHSRLAESFAEIRKEFGVHLETILRVEQAASAELSKWQESQDEHVRLYQSAAESAKEHKQKLDLIKSLRIQEAAIEKQIADLTQQTVDCASVTSAFAAGWRDWVTMHRGRGDLLESACKTLTEKSDGEIEAELLRGADHRKAVALLKDMLRGCNIREAHWDDLTEYLTQNVPADGWMALMEQLQPLAEMALEDIAADGSVPEIPCWTLTPGIRRNIVERLKPSRRWLELALTSLEDLPVFYYKPAGASRIRFEAASAGQQATALLKVLLKETTGPLIIDQPEDDLDNATIQQIAEELWQAKERRQIIFSSHNANIVVNGDAELVVHCDYREMEDRTTGEIANQGSIDTPEIRDAIKRIMEGGEKAFQLRSQKYGF